MPVCFKCFPNPLRRSADFAALAMFGSAFTNCVSALKISSIIDKELFESCLLHGFSSSVNLTVL